MPDSDTLPQAPTSEPTKAVDTLPEVGIEAGRTLLKLKAAQNAVFVEDLRELLRKDRESVASWRGKLIGGASDSAQATSAPLSEDDMAGINIGDVYNITQPAPPPSVPATPAPLAAAQSGASSLLKYAAIAGLSAALGGAAPLVAGYLTAKPTAAPVIPKFEAPNWDLEVVPQQQGGSDAGGS